MDLLNDPFQCMALLQHHGLPTRLLDFTHSFYVAAHFACWEARSSDTAAVWAINAVELQEEASSRLTCSPRRFQSSDFYEELWVAAGDTEPNAVWQATPFRMNERLALQQGTFLLQRDITATFEESILNTFEISPERHKDDVLQLADLSPTDIEVFTQEESILKILLPPGAVQEARVQLRRMNITEATLFPGFDGFARSLRGHLYPGVEPADGTAASHARASDRTAWRESLDAWRDVADAGRVEIPSWLRKDMPF